MPRLHISATRMVRQCFESEAHRCSVVCAAWQCPCVSLALIRVTNAKWCSRPAAASSAWPHVRGLSPSLNSRSSLQERGPLLGRVANNPACQRLDARYRFVSWRRIRHLCLCMVLAGLETSGCNKVGPDCLGSSSMGTQTLETLACKLATNRDQAWLPPSPHRGRRCRMHRPSAVHLCFYLQASAASRWGLQ